MSGRLRDTWPFGMSHFFICHKLCCWRTRSTMNAYDDFATSEVREPHITWYPGLAQVFSCLRNIALRQYNGNLVLFTCFFFSFLFFFVFLKCNPFFSHFTKGQKKRAICDVFICVIRGSLLQRSLLPWCQLTVVGEGFMEDSVADGVLPQFWVLSCFPSSWPCDPNSTRLPWKQSHHYWHKGICPQ